MASLNKVTLIGNLGKDPEIRATQSGQEIASFSVACSTSWKDKNTGERKDKTEWISVVVFNESLVKVIKQYAKKGSKIYLEGALATRKWTDKNGIERYITEVVLQAFNGKIILLDGKGGNENEPEPSRHTQDKQNAYVPEDDMIDEIPF